MGLICKPRPCTKKATRVSVPGNMVVYHASVAQRAGERRRVRQGVPLHVVAAEFSMAWVSHGRD